MKSDVVDVPVSLLTSADLRASAKLIWMVAQLGPPQAAQALTPWLAATSGVVRQTAYTAVADLTAADWSPTRAPDPQAPTLPIPTDLLTNRRLGAHARVLYGLLQLLPGFRHQFGETTYAELSAIAHASRHTLARALGELARAEWIKLERAHRLDRIHYEFTFPGLARGMAAIEEAQRRIAKAKPVGEAIMREFLSLLIDCDEFTDNARPGFLKSPRTGEPLEFDRFYPPDLAFEHNGPHHERETDTVSAGESAIQQERDLIKQGICTQRGITLVVVRPEDLTLATMQQKVGTHRPLRDLSGDALLIDYLEDEAHRYRQWSERKGR